MRRRWLPLLVAATAGAAPAVGTPPPAPAHAEEHVVTMAGTAYAPAEIRAEVGDTIRFVNDAVDHNVYVPTAGFGLDLGKQEPGAETTVRLKAGAFEVECVSPDHGGPGRGGRVGGTAERRRRG